MVLRFLALFGALLAPLSAHAQSAMSGGDGKGNLVVTVFGGGTPNYIPVFVNYVKGNSLTCIGSPCGTAPITWITNLDTNGYPMGSSSSFQYSSGIQLATSDVYVSQAFIAMWTGTAGTTSTAGFSVGFSTSGAGQITNDTNCVTGTGHSGGTGSVVSRGEGGPISVTGQNCRFNFITDQVGAGSISWPTGTAMSSSSYLTNIAIIRADQEGETFSATFADNGNGTTTMTITGNVVNTNSLGIHIGDSVLGCIGTTGAVPSGTYVAALGTGGNGGVGTYIVSGDFSASCTAAIGVSTFPSFNPDYVDLIKTLNPSILRGLTSDGVNYADLRSSYKYYPPMGSLSWYTTYIPPSAEFGGHNTAGTFYTGTAEPTSCATAQVGSPGVGAVFCGPNEDDYNNTLVVSASAPCSPACDGETVWGYLYQSGDIGYSFSATAQIDNGSGTGSGTVLTITTSTTASQNFTSGVSTSFTVASCTPFSKGMSVSDVNAASPGLIGQVSSCSAGTLTLVAAAAISGSNGDTLYPGPQIGQGPFVSYTGNVINQQLVAGTIVTAQTAANKWTVSASQQLPSQTVWFEPTLNVGGRGPAIIIQGQAAASSIGGYSLSNGHPTYTDNIHIFVYSSVFNAWLWGGSNTTGQGNPNIYSNSVYPAILPSLFCAAVNKDCWRAVPVLFNTVAATQWANAVGPVNPGHKTYVQVANEWAIQYYTQFLENYGWRLGYPNFDSNGQRAQASAATFILERLTKAMQSVWPSNSTVSPINQLWVVVGASNAAAQDKWKETYIGEDLQFDTNGLYTNPYGTSTTGAVPTATATFNGTTTISLSQALNLPPGYGVYFTNSGGALPTGLSLVTNTSSCTGTVVNGQCIYYNVEVSGSNSVQVSATIGGTAISLTGGTGTTTLTYCGTCLAISTNWATSPNRPIDIPGFAPSTAFYWAPSNNPTTQGNQQQFWVTNNPAVSISGITAANPGCITLSSPPSGNAIAAGDRFQLSLTGATGAIASLNGAWVTATSGAGCSITSTQFAIASNPLGVFSDYGQGSSPGTGSLSFSASAYTVGWNSHGLSNGQAIEFFVGPLWNSGNFTIYHTAGILPGSMTAGTTYYVANAATNTFQVCTDASGSTCGSGCPPTCTGSAAGIVNFSGWTPTGDQAVFAIQSNNTTGGAFSSGTATRVVQCINGGVSSGCSYGPIDATSDYNSGNYFQQQTALNWINNDARTGTRICLSQSINGNTCTSTSATQSAYNTSQFATTVQYFSTLYSLSCADTAGCKPMYLYEGGQGMAPMQAYVAGELGLSATFANQYDALLEAWFYSPYSAQITQEYYNLFLSLGYVHTPASLTEATGAWGMRANGPGNQIGDIYHSNALNPHGTTCPSTGGSGCYGTHKWVWPYNIFFGFMNFNAAP